jgi:hypothetical protein
MDSLMRHAVVMLLTAGTCLAAVKNGGFEKTTVLATTSPQHQAMVKKGWIIDDPCVVPRGWTPNPYRANCTYRLIDDQGQAHTGNHCITIDGDLYTSLGDVQSDQVVTASVWARGKAGTRAWVVLYSYGTNDAGKPVFLGDGLRVATFTVTSEWKQYTGSILVPPGVTRVNLALRGEGVFFDDAEGLARTATADEMRTLPRGTAASGPPPAAQTSRKSNADSLSLSPQNAGFEAWQTLLETPQHWTLRRGLFPGGWIPDSYKGVPSTAGQARASADSGGRHALFLRGQIVSGKIQAQGTLRRRMLISVRARGSGGRLYVGLRAYGPVREAVEEFRFLSDVIDTATTDAWQLYTGLLDLTTGPNAVYGRLQIEADGVILDDVQVRCVKADATSSEPMQLVLPPASLTGMPRVDGRVAPGEWSAATELTGFANIDTHALVTRQTQVSLMSDGATLLLCFRSPTAGQTLRAAVTERDGDVWTDDAIEIFVGKWPEKGTPTDQYQFIINPKGTVFDLHRVTATGTNLKEWNCAGLEVASTVADGVWTAELAIPLSEVGVKPGRSARFGLQLCRDLTSPSEWCSLTGQGYRSLFECRFQEGAPTIRWEAIGMIRTGKLNLRLSVRNPHAEPQHLQAAIALTGALERDVEEQITLPPGEEADLALRCADVGLIYGRFRLQVSDTDGAALFHQSVLLDTQSSMDAAPVGSRKIQVEFYPIQRKANVRVRHVAEPDRNRFAAADLTLYHEGHQAWSHQVETPLWAGNEAHFTVRFDDVAFQPVPGATYAMKAVLRATDGTVTDIATGDFEPRDLPWQNNRLGQDSEVIPPFTPIRATGTTLTCWGREHNLAASGFPSTITSRGIDVLAGPIQLTGQWADGTPIELSPTRGSVTFSKREEHEVQFTAESAADTLRVQVHGLMEQDGMIKYELDLVPQQAAGLRRLSLEIPLAVDTYMHCARDRIRVNCEWSFLPEGDGVLWRSGQKENVRGIHGTFAPFVWVGGEKAGLCWFADNDRGWVNSETSDCLEIIRTGGRTVLRVNIVAPPATITAPRHIVFGIQATPVRPTPVAPQHQMVMNYFGFDNPIVRKYGMGLISKDLHLAEKILAPRKQRGETAHVYMANDITPIADPIGKTCYFEWALPSFDTYKGPLAQFGRRVNGLDPRNYIAFFNGAVPSRIDYNLHCLDTLFTTSLSGLYLDNSYPKACTNVQHPACGYVRDDGNLQGGFNLFGTRELVKRAAILAYKRGGLRPHVSVHMTDAMVIPCFSFAGLCIDGEDRSQLSMERDFMDSWPLERVAILGAVDWGPMRGWLPKIHFPAGMEGVKPTRTMVAELKLFDMWIWYAHCNRSVVQRLEKIEADCGIGQPGTRFLGYWENAEFARVDHPDAKASFYVRPGEVVLMYVTNFSREPVEVGLALNLAEFGLRDLSATDAENSKALSMTDGVLEVDIPPHDFRLIKLTSR